MEDYINALTKQGVVKTTPALRMLGRYAQLSSEGDEQEQDLRRDCFWTYYLPGAELREEVPPERMVNKAVLNWALESEMFKQSRFDTMGRMAISSLSADFLAHYLLNDEEVQKALEEQREAAEQMQNAPAGPEGDEQRERAKQRLEQALADFEDYKQSGPGQASRAEAIQQANDEAGDVKTVMTTWGMGDGPGAQVDVKGVQEMVKKMNADFINQVAKLMGRAQSVGLKVQTEQTKKAQVVTDAGYTNDILDVFPSNRMILLDESISREAHLMKLGEYATHGLVGMVKSTEATAAGSLYFVVDGSGSMRHNRHLLAKALTMGIAKAAEENGQNWMASVFGDSEADFTPPITQESTPEQVINFVGRMPGGGTDFDIAIKEALRYIDDVPDKNEIDLVFITDGEAGLSSDSVELLNQARRRHGIRLMTLLVDGGYGDINDASYYTAEIHSNEDIAKAAEGLAQALWRTDGD